MVSPFYHPFELAYYLSFSCITWFNTGSIIYNSSKTMQVHLHLSAYFFLYQYNSVFHFAMPEALDGLIVAIGTIGTYLDSKDSLEFLRHFKGIPILTLEEPL